MMYSGNPNNEKLVGEILGHVAELKKIFFTSKQPVTDNETQLHHFCVKLEHVLRFGQKEKYSIIGGRKDYWNFIAEALPKDETVRFIQALGDTFKSNQGKGRAFIRQALAEKTLADTLQRCVIHHKNIRDWYHHASILRDPELFGILLHTLYDLNSVEFTLPYKGYDLDRAWPAFARKSFSDGVQTQKSVNDVDGGKKDPLPAVAAQVEAIKSLVADSSGKAQSATKAILEEVSMQQVMNGLVEIYHDLGSWKNMSNQKMQDLAMELAMVAKEKELLERESKAKEVIKETLQEESDKAKEYYGKLRVAEIELNDMKFQVKALKGKLADSEKELEANDITLSKAHADVMSLQKEVEKLNDSVIHLSSEMESKDSKQLELMAKIVSLEDIVKYKETLERELEKEAIELKSQLGQKEIELDSVRETFEKATGIVAGSFKEFEKEVTSKVSEKDKTVEMTKDENRALYFRYESSKREADALKDKILEVENELIDEKKVRENAEKVIQELKEKFAEEKRKCNSFEDMVDGIIVCLSGMDAVDGIIDDEDGLTKKKDKKWVLEKLNVIHSQLVDTIKDKEEYEGQSVALKHEVNQLSQKVDDMKSDFEEEIRQLTEEKNELTQKLDDLETENRKLAAEAQSRNEEIFNLSVQLTDTKEELSNKKAELERLSDTLAVIVEDIDNFKLLKENLEREKKTLEEEVDLKEDQIRMLGMDSEAQVTELHGKVEDLSKKLYEVQDKLAKTEVSLTGRVEINTRLDQKVSSLKDEMQSLRQTKDQEIQALKFKLSSEEMKHEGALRALSEKLRECDAHQKNVEDLEGMVESFKGNIQEGHDTWQKERETLIFQNENQTDEITEQKEKIEKLESEISVLEHELLRTTRQRDEEKSQRIIQAEKLEVVLSDAKGKEKQMQSAMELMQRDVQELKAHLVAVTKEKSDLWQRSDLLEFELKQRSEGRWVDDEEATKCSDCGAEFSLLIRKHHCRICGHIFCAMCSNNWVRTQHSRKKVRSCNDCAHHEAARANTSASEADLDETRSMLDEQPRNGSMLSHIDPEIEAERPDVEETYEVLSEKDVGEPNEFKPIEEITLLNTDIECEPLLPSLTHDDEISKERKEVQIAARQRYLIPVVVGSTKVDLCWEFNSYPKDIGFGVLYKHDEQTENSEVETIMALMRYPSDKRTIFGTVKIDKPGIYILVFDNSFSRLTSKDVTCLVGLQRSPTLH